MDERRKDVRDKVLFGGIASNDAKPPKDCVVRDISDHGARVEFKSGARLPKDQISLAIARKGKSFLAKIIWWRDNIVGVAFTEPPQDAFPKSDIEERLRKSEKKKRQLQRQINDLLGQ
jgi:hypothetical protein